MKRALLVGVFLWAGLAMAQTGGGIVREGKEEVLYLDDLVNPTRWVPSECTVEASSEIKFEGRPTLHVHIPVDHFAGEQKYPIGWPRVYLTLKKPTETSWGEFERFEFMFYAKMSRPEPPGNAATFQIQCPDKNTATYHQFTKPKLEEWSRIVVPTSKIKGLENIARLGFHISESNYKHGDKLDFYFAAFRLVRSAEFEVKEMKLAKPAVFRGEPKLKLEMIVTGPPAQISRGLPWTLRQGERVLRKEMLPVRAGIQSVEIEIGELKLDPGKYELVAFDDDPGRRKSVEFRIVETPWEEKR